MEDYPSNTQRRKVQEPKDQPEEKKVQRVTSGGVSRRKKPLGRRMAEVFTGDATRGVLDYVVFDVAIPAAKDMFFDMITQGAERKLFGEVRSRSRSSIRTSGSGWTPYHRASSGGFRREEPPRGMSRQGRATHNFDELVFDNRVDAEVVLSDLEHLVREYEVATVRDLYDLCGETASYTDEKYGWSSLEGAGVRRAGTRGYLIILPRPEPIN